jgi:glyoxylase-like metal-dependent hydrolase (beta-lactamase superfamily II)/rhodanese-related sulfurtransferase
MVVEQLYTGCLAEAAYYIESNGEVAIIDPLRETTPYVVKAADNGAKIKYIFLTHFHADFVSGHVDLAKKTGATIVYGPSATAEYEFHEGTDNEEFKIGDINLTLMHTPGHTMESSSYVLTDKNGNQKYIFTGDALFIGDVGRPDLAVKSNVTQEDLAGHLFDSLRNKIMKLPDDIIVYPNHGAGSACGKNMSEETFDTLGHQKEVNYALRSDMTKAEFIDEVLTGLVDPPQYFPKNVMMNKGINTSYADILATGVVAREPEEFEALAKEKGAVVLDTRHEQIFKDSFLPGSFNFNIDDNFAPWVGTLIENIESPILIVADDGREEEVVTRLARVGYDNTIGYLKGGVEAWAESGRPVDSIVSISPEELKMKMIGKVNIVDVRKASEYYSERLDTNMVSNKPLDLINTNLTEYDKNKEYYMHCVGGYRSMIAASILKANGIENVIDINGGFNEMKEAGLQMTEYVCPTTML